MKTGSSFHPVAFFLCMMALFAPLLSSCAGGVSDSGSESAISLSLNYAGSGGKMLSRGITPGTPVYIAVSGDHTADTQAARLP